MKLTYENLGTNTYLVYEICETDELDSMSLGMLTNNSIPGFVPASFTQMDTTKYIRYNVSAKVSVTQLFTGPVNKKRLIGVISGVVDAMLAAEDYMLDPATILLDKDYIFADVSSCEAEMVCLPITNLQRETVDLASFFKNILFTTQFDQTENCDHVAQLINYLNTNPVLVLSDFKALLITIGQGAAAQPKVTPVAAQPVQPVVQPVQQPVAQPVREEPAKPVQPVVPVVQPVVPQPAAISTPVPAKPAPATPPAAPAAAETEKPMSWFYLMQHYNAENAAKYKAQREAAKGATPATAAPIPTPAQAKPATSIPGVCVPGQTGSNAPKSGIAIPGQPTPPPAPAKTPVSTPVQPSVPAKPAQQPAAPVQTNPYHQPPVAPASQAMNFGETTVLGGGNVGETTVLGVAPVATQPKPYLIRLKNNEKINLDKPVFRVGKEKSYVDYFIGDNTAISRSHANFITRDGAYFVVDTNSTNHTYVNGVMAQSNVETPLSHGDKVRLANEEFEFKLY